MATKQSKEVVKIKSNVQQSFGKIGLILHTQSKNFLYSLEQTIVKDGSKPALESHEWLRKFQTLRPFLTNHLPVPSNKCHILHLGCGNSSLTADFHSLGYTEQTSVDFSEVVINAMKTKYSALDTRWCVMDVRELQLPDCSVDVAIDKGTLDAMIHGSLLDPPADVRNNIGRYKKQVARVLMRGGLWLCISFRQPLFIKPLLTEEDLWTLTVEVLEGPEDAGSLGYFAFIMRRHPI